MSNRITTLENTIAEYAKSSRGLNSPYTTGETNSQRYQSENMDEYYPRRNNSWSDILQELKVDIFKKRTKTQKVQCESL